MNQIIILYSAPFKIHRLRIIPSSIKYEKSTLTNFCKDRKEKLLSKLQVVVDLGHMQLLTVQFYDNDMCG